MEVKDEDLEKFERGELVEPKKPIVYYIDRATPKKWAPYLKQGIGILNGGCVNIHRLSAVAENNILIAGFSHEPGTPERLN